VFRLSEFDEKLLDSQRRDSATKELLARHETEIEERHATIRHLESELDQANGELDRVKNKLGQVVEERQRLADELANAKGELEQRHADNKSELDRMRLELGQVREERSRLTSDLDGVRRQLIESEGRTHCAVQELNCVRSELTDLDRNMNESLIEHQELRDAKRYCDKLCQTLSTDVEKLKVKLADVEGQLVTTQRSKEDLEKTLSR